MADELIYMFSTLSIIKEINSVNCKGYVKKKLEIKLGTNLWHINAIRDRKKDRKKRDWIRKARKRNKGIKIITSKTLLTRLLILLEQVQNGIN